MLKHIKTGDIIVNNDNDGLFLYDSFIDFLYSHFPNKKINPFFILFDHPKENLTAFLNNTSI